MCLVCKTVLTNDSMRKNKLKTHFKGKHKELIGKPVQFFKDMKEQFYRELANLHDDRCAHDAEVFERFKQIAAKLRKLQNNG